MATKLKRSKEKPTAGFILTLLGGLLILVSGLISVTAGLLISSVLHISALFIASGSLGIICGAVVIASSVLMHDEENKKRKNWSVVALVFGILSLVNLGGFLVGFILTLVGGVFGLAHE
jgi:MFS family permease